MNRASWCSIILWKNNLTMVPQPLGIPFNFNDTIAELNRCNQHKTNTIRKELWEIWLSNLENSIIINKEFRTYRCVYQELNVVYILGGIPGNSNTHCTIDRLVTTIDMGNISLTYSLYLRTFPYTFRTIITSFHCCCMWRTPIWHVCPDCFYENLNR